MPPKPPKKPPLTHFLCLPLVTPSSRPQLQASLSRFAADVTAPNENGEVVLPPKAIRPVGAIHFTLGVMSLQTPERVEEVKSYLHGLDVRRILNEAAESVEQEVDQRASSSPSSAATATGQIARLATAPSASDTASLSPPSALTISLQGLHPLPTPQKTSSLYASPSPTHPIHLFALLLQRAFAAAGFLLPVTRPLLLHATLANTIYARTASSGKKRWGKGSGRFDSGDLCARWGGEVWAEGVVVERVAVCEMGAKKIYEGDGEGRVVVDEVYEEVASVGLV